MINNVVPQENWNEGEVSPYTKRWVAGKGTSSWGLTPQPQFQSTGERRGKRSSWIGRENKSWYPVLTDGLGNSRYDSQAAIPKSNRGPGGNTASSIFPEWLTRTLGNSSHQLYVCAGWGEYQEGPVRGSEVMFHRTGMQGSVVNAVWSLCTCLDYSLHSWCTLAEEPQCHPTLSSIVGVSLPLPVLPEVHFCLDRMEISLVPRQTFQPSTNDWQKSFLPCAYFVPVSKRDLDAPPKKGIKHWGSMGF